MYLQLLIRTVIIFWHWTRKYRTVISILVIHGCLMAPESVQPAVAYQGEGSCFVPVVHQTVKSFSADVWLAYLLPGLVNTIVYKSLDPCPMGPSPDTSPDDHSLYWDQWAALRVSNKDLSIGTASPRGRHSFLPTSLIRSNHCNTRHHRLAHGDHSKEQLSLTKAMPAPWFLKEMYCEINFWNDFISSWNQRGPGIYGSVK